MQREDDDEVQQRMTDFDSDYLTLLQARPQNMLRSGLDAADKTPISCHSTGEYDRWLVWTEFSLKNDLLEPVHTRTGSLHRAEQYSNCC